MTLIYTALDTTDLEEAENLAQALAPHTGLKLGLEFFLAHGAAGYARMAKHTKNIFLDLKLHDIPNTVAGALRAVLPLQPRYITLHCSGGAAMMQAAAKTVAEAKSDTHLLGVTVLTSLDAADLSAVGQVTNEGADVTGQVVRLAKLAEANGLHGIVCAPTDIQAVRAAVGANFVLMVPGIRPAGADTGDQKRVLTPLDAVQAGATHLVIGRPITQSPSPAKAAQTIIDQVG